MRRYINISVIINIIILFIISIINILLIQLNRKGLESQWRQVSTRVHRQQKQQQFQLKSKK